MKRIEVFAILQLSFLMLHVIFLQHGYLNKNDKMDIKTSDITIYCTKNNEMEQAGNSLLPKYPDPGRYMIYECDGVCGGLGDRQKGIVAAYLISLLTNRTFGIKHVKPMNLSKYLIPNKINWIVKDTELKGLSHEKHKMSIGREFVKNVSDLDLNKIYTKDIVYFHGNIEHVTALRKHYDASRVIPDIMRMSNSEIYNWILKTLFKLENSLQEKLNMIYESKIRGRKLVCAHVRIGKNPTIPTDIKQNLATKDLEGIWNLLDRFNLPEIYAIFVASDSREIKGYAQKKFPLQYVDVPGPIIHIDQIGYRNYTEGLAKIFLEQTLLSQCDVLVITKSGFSRNAAYLRNSARDLYCYLNGTVFPCRHDLLDQIY